MNQMFCSLQQIIAQTEDKPLFVASNVEPDDVTRGKKKLYIIKFNLISLEAAASNKKTPTTTQLHKNLCVFNSDGEAERSAKLTDVNIDEEKSIRLDQAERTTCQQEA